MRVCLYVCILVTPRRDGCCVLCFRASYNTPYSYCTCLSILYVSLSTGPVSQRVPSIGVLYILSYPIYIHPHTLYLLYLYTHPHTLYTYYIYIHCIYGTVHIHTTYTLHKLCIHTYSTCIGLFLPLLAIIPILVSIGPCCVSSRPFGPFCPFFLLPSSFRPHPPPTQTQYTQPARRTLRRYSRL